MMPPFEIEGMARDQVLEVTTPRGRGFLVQILFQCWWDRAAGRAVIAHAIEWWAPVEFPTPNQNDLMPWGADLLENVPSLPALVAAVAEKRAEFAKALRLWLAYGRGDRSTG